MKQKEEIKLLSDKLDKLNRKEEALLASNDVELIAAHKAEKDALFTEITRLRGEVEVVLSSKAQKLMNMPFKRAITKKEQSDMGAFKKSLKTKVEIIHPMTALGREMKLKDVTGFAVKAF